jgi:hypothetical protein
MHEGVARRILHAGADIDRGEGCLLQIDHDPLTSRNLLDTVSKHPASGAVNRQASSVSDQSSCWAMSSSGDKKRIDSYWGGRMVISISSKFRQQLSPASS